MELAILFGLIVLNGAFAMSEIALVAARKTRLQRLIDEGDKGARAAATLGADPTRFMSAIQIGITSISVLNGIVGEAVFAVPFAQWLVTVGLAQPWAGYGATALVVMLITYVTIVLGELVPKRIGQTRPEAIARLVAQPITWLAAATRPFVRLLSGSTNGILRLLGVHHLPGSAVTEDEIRAVLEEGTSAGVIEKHEHAMVRNVFSLDDRQLGSLMVPRGDVVCLDANDPFEANLARIEESDHARFPVVRGGLVNILGVVNARRLKEREPVQVPFARDLLFPRIELPGFEVQMAQGPVGRDVIPRRIDLYRRPGSGAHGAGRLGHDPLHHAGRHLSRQRERGEQDQHRALG